MILNCFLGHCIRKLLLLLPNSRSASGRCDVIGNYSLSKTKKNKVYLDDDDNACRKPEYFRIQYIPPKINFPDDISNYRVIMFNGLDVSFIMAH